MIRPGCRSYSQGFNIASYVERIQEIAKKQQAPKQRKPRAVDAQGRSNRQEGRPERSNRQGSFAGRANANEQENRAGFKGKDGPVQSRPGFRPQNGQTGPNQNPYFNRPNFRNNSSNGQNHFNNNSKNFNQTRTETLTLDQAPTRAPTRAARTPMAPKADAKTSTSDVPSGAFQSFAFQENKPVVRKPRGQKPNRRPKRQGSNTRIAVRQSITPQQRQAINAVPLVVSAKESLDAVLRNTSSGFVEIDSLEPSSIASALVKGPSFNSRFWAVVNNQKVHGDIEAAVNSQINGEFAPFIIKGDEISENAARTLSANSSLSTDQKQFLARVAAGSMAPSQVKQMRI